MNCLVCNTSALDCLYTSAGSISITSLATTIEAPTVVRFCQNCGHLQTDEAVDIDQYYDDSYNINTGSDEEDQLYSIVNGKPLYRNAHQASAVLSRVELGDGARVLDHGCGPGHTARAIAAEREDLNIHVFEVSQNYQTAWRKWLPESNMAYYEIPIEWQKTFDLVVSFFALEHVSSPQGFVRELYNLLRPGGQAYIVIPNTYQNIADFIVVDHVNHFSSVSLRWLLTESGFTVDHVSDTDHASAWTAVATRPDTEAEPVVATHAPAAVAHISVHATEMADFWTLSESRIKQFETETGDLTSTIYGSGFYGCYLYTRLSAPEQVQGFVDRNPHQQKKTLFGHSITPPGALSAMPQTIWVGLNPRIASTAIAELSDWHGRPYNFFYL